MQHLGPHLVISKLKYRGKRRIGSVAIVQCLDSTNDYLLDKDNLPEHDFALCIAEQQTKGRGRRGRQWISPAGGHVYLSLAWKVAANRAPDHWYGLASATAVAQYLAGLSHADVGVKWPNDIYCDGHKLGGILLEKKGNTYVLGLGLNASLDTAHKQELKTPCTSLQQIAINTAYPDLVATMVTQLCTAVDRTDSRATSTMQRLFAMSDLTRNKEVKIESADKSVSGTALGVNAEGLLMLKTKQGITLCNANECSLVL